MHDLGFIGLRVPIFLDPDDVMIAMLVAITHPMMSASLQGPWFDQSVRKGDIIVVIFLPFLLMVVFCLTGDFFATGVGDAYSDIWGIVACYLLCCL